MNFFLYLISLYISQFIWKFKGNIRSRADCVVIAAQRTQKTPSTDDFGRERVRALPENRWMSYQIGVILYNNITWGMV